MIDLSAMKGIVVDPGRGRCGEGGVLWGALNRETQLHGLAVTGGLCPRRGSPGSRSGVASAG